MIWVVRILHLVVLLCSSHLLWANAPSKVSRNKVYSFVTVSKTIEVSPRDVCHNGLQIFFKDKPSCLRAGILGFDCGLNPELAPLRSVEKIYAQSGSKDYITRFYHIDLRYRYQEVDPQTGHLFVDKELEVPQCENRRTYITENVRSERVVQTKAERIFVQSLIDQSKLSEDQSFLIINTPIGNVEYAERLGLKDHGKSERERIQQAKVKTPFCSDYGSDLIWKMSGEYTGSGKQSLLPARLQRVSRPLYLSGKKSVLNKETGEKEDRYTFTCETVWDL